MADTTNLGLGGVNNPFLGQDNPYLTNAIDMASQDMVRNYNLATQPAYNAAAINSGSFGNSAINELNQNANRQLQSNLGDLASKLRFNDYSQQANIYQNQQNFNEGQRQFDQNMGRSTYNDAYSQNMGNLQAGIGLLGTLGGYNTTDLNNATTQQNAPMNYWQQFTNGINSIGQGYGTSTGTGTTGTSTNYLNSALGGAQLGSSFQNWWNSGNNSGGITGTGGQSGIDNYGSSNPSTNYFGSGFL